MAPIVISIALTQPFPLTVLLLEGQEEALRIVADVNAVAVLLAVLMVSTIVMMILMVIRRNMVGDLELAGRGTHDTLQRERARTVLQMREIPAIPR